MIPEYNSIDDNKKDTPRVHPLASKVGKFIFYGLMVPSSAVILTAIVFNASPGVAELVGKLAGQIVLSAAFIAPVVAVIFSAIVAGLINKYKQAKMQSEIKQSLENTNLQGNSTSSPSEIISESASVFINGIVAIFFSGSKVSGKESGSTPSARPNH